jgi:putative transposase
VGIEISASSIRRVIAPKRRPGPKRDTWSKFMRTQAASIVACDLFTVETVRMKTLHVLFFIDLHTRRVLLGGVTDGATNLRWCTQIARNLSEARESRSTPLRFLVHNRDHRFGEPFDEVFKAEGVEIIRTPWRAPRANAYAERFVRTVRTECLDRIFVLSERHLESVLKTYLKHHNRERPIAGSTSEYPRADRHSASQEPLDRSCAAIASVALSTNTIGRRRSPSTSTATAVLHTALIRVRGSIQARLCSSA